MKKNFFCKFNKRMWENCEISIFEYERNFFDLKIEKWFSDNWQIEEKGIYF